MRAWCTCPHRRCAGCQMAEVACIMCVPSPWGHAWAGFFLLLAPLEWSARELHNNEVLPDVAGLGAWCMCPHLRCKGCPLTLYACMVHLLSPKGPLLPGS